MTEAQEHIKLSESKRNDLARSIRESRNELREVGIPTQKFNHFWYREIYRAPQSVTPISLLRQLRHAANFAATPVPDLTMDDGYSRCGEEDYQSNRRDFAAKHAHMLLNAYMIQMRKVYDD